MKKHLLKKLRLRAVMLVALLCAGFSGAWGETATWPGTTALPEDFTTMGNTPIQIMVSSTNSYTSPIRVYSGTTISIKAAPGYVIQSVTYEASATGNYVTNAKEAKVNPQVTPTVSSKYVTWSYGNNSEVTEFTFAPNSQTRCNSISVTYNSTGGSTPTYTVTLGDDNTELTETFGGLGVTLPTRNAQGVFEFQGWSEDELETETTTEPTIIPAGTYNPTSNITLYPIYKRTETVGTISDTGNVFESGSYSGSNQTITWSIDNVVSIVQEKDRGQNAPNSNYVSAPRWYTDNKITITPSNIINSITVTANTEGYATALASSAYTNASASASGTNVTITPINGDQAITIVMGGQSRLASLIVTYGGGTTTTYYTSNPVVVAFNSYGYATYASNKVVDYSTTATNGKYTAWKITGVDNNTGTINFAQITSAVAPGTGVLLMGIEKDTQNNFVPATIKFATEGENISSTNILQGIIVATPIESGQYYGLKDNQFVPVLAGTVPAGKALLSASDVGLVKSLNLVFTDETGIREVRTVSTEEAAEIFNLAGQRLQKPQRGVNIMNGKKVLVK